MDFHENELVSLYLSELNEIDDASSELQNVKLFVHPLLGKVLVINGEIQHIENYQCPYHELLVHLPAAFIREPRKVLIIGGGSLFAAYEALKYPCIEHIDLCDYDSNVLSLMTKHYDHAQKVMGDLRFHFINEDARHYIANSDNRYDIVINDCFNILAESEKSATSMFTTLSDLLFDDGICCDVIYRHIFDKYTVKNSIVEIRKSSNLRLAPVTVPEYPGILHIQVLWGKNTDLGSDIIELKNLYQLSVANDVMPFEFYNPTYLSYYFYLPPYIKNKIM